MKKYFTLKRKNKEPVASRSKVETKQTHVVVSEEDKTVEEGKEQEDEEQEDEVDEEEEEEGKDPHIILIKAGQCSFPSERLTLIKYSQYFRQHPDIIDGDVIELEADITWEIYGIIHKWITTDDGIPLDEDNVVSVFSAARKLKIRKLVNQCGHFIKDYLLDGESDPMPVYEKICLSYESDLYTMAHDIVMERCMDIVHSDYYLHYNVDQLNLMLNDDYIVLPSEKSVFEAVVRWLNFDLINREEHVQSALACVRLTSMNGNDLLECSESVNATAIRELQECKDAFFQAFHYRLAVDTSMEHLLPELNPVPRKALTVNLCADTESTCGDNCANAVPRLLGGKCTHLSSRKILDSGHNRTLLHHPGCSVYSPFGRSPMIANLDEYHRNNRGMAAGSDRDYKKVSRLDETFGSLITAVTDAPLYNVKSVQQVNDGKQVNVKEPTKQAKIRACIILQKYVRGFNVRQQIKKMHYSAAVIQGHFRDYLERKQKQEAVPRACAMNPTPVLGLLDTDCLLLFSRPDQTHQYVLRYDPKRDRWSSIVQMQHNLEGFSAAVLDGHVYITGGVAAVCKRQRRALATTWSLNSRNASWSQCRMMLEARREHTLVVGNGKLYAIGGIDANNSLLSSNETFSPSTNEWQSSSPSPMGRACAAVCVHRNLVWVCGGIADSPRTRQPMVIDRVDCYDLLRNYWYKQASLPVALCSASAVSVRECLWVVGGSSSFKSTDGSDVVYSFDSIKQMWKKVLTLPRPRCKAVVAELASNVYFIGGVVNPLSADCFSLDTGHWFTIRTLPRSTLHSHVVLTCTTKDVTKAKSATKLHTCKRVLFPSTH